MKSRIPLLALILGSLAFWNGAALHAATATPPTKPLGISTLITSGTLGLLGGPTGVVPDNQGNLYVIDNSLIRKIDTNLNVITIAGWEGVTGITDGQGTNATFQWPQGITADSQGNLYVTDYDTIRKIDTNLNVTTIAGQPGVSGSTDGQGTNATFYGPQGITADSQGNLFVTGNGTIRKIDTNLNVTTIAGRAGVSGSADGQGTNATFSGTNGITSDSQGNLYVTDGGNTVRKIDTNLNVTTIAGQAGVAGSTDGQGTNATFDYPAGITADSQGNLYVVDLASSTIRKIDSNNNVTTIAGQAGVSGSTDGQGTNATFDYLNGITIDSQGNLYVTDNGKDTIRKIDSNNNVTTIAGQAGVSGSSDGPSNNPDYFFQPSIVSDQSGNLFVANNDNHDIWKIGTNDTVITIAGQTGVSGSTDGQGTNATFGSFGGITVDAQGNLYVTDSGDTVRKIDTNYTVTTIAGQAGVSGGSNSQGTNATFSGLQGITADSQGNLFVADAGNNDVRKIDTNLNVTTAFKLTGPIISLPIPEHIAVDAHENIFITFAINFPNRAPISGIEEWELFPWRTGFGTNRVTQYLYRPHHQIFGGEITGAYHYFGDIAVDVQGNLYTTDTHYYDDVILKINTLATNWNVTTIAGQAGVPGNDGRGTNDGEGTNATFTGPQGITLDGQGNLYISDQTTIREGVFLTLQTINFGPLHAKTYGDPPFSLTATASSGLPVSYSSSDSSVAAVSNNTLTIVGVGSATITASQAGATNYATATPVSQILKVAQGTQHISFGKIPTQTYAPGSTFSLTATNSSGLSLSYASSNPKVATVSGSLVTITGAGSTTITASETINPNFKAAVPVRQVLTVAKATQPLIFKTPPSEPFVQGNTFTLSANTSSNVTFKSSNPHIISVNGTTATINGKGTVTITASLAGDGNYKPAVKTAQVKVQENP